VANTLKLHRNGASLLAKAFGVGFIGWLGEREGGKTVERNKHIMACFRLLGEEAGFAAFVVAAV